MKHILTTITVFFITISYAQDAQTTEFFRQFSKRRIHYTYFLISKDQTKNIKKIIGRKKIVGLNSSINIESYTLLLAEEERQYINNELDKLSLPESQGFLKGVPKYKHLKDFDPKKRRNVYWFSKPIFIRNNSICLLYSGWRCGPECMGDQWKFYKIIDGKWTDWITLILSLA